MVYLCCCGSLSCIGMTACFSLQGDTVAPSSNHSRDVVSYETETARVMKCLLDVDTSSLS